MRVAFKRIGPPLAGLFFVLAACSKPEAQWTLRGYRGRVEPSSEVKLSACRRGEFRGGPAIRCDRTNRYRNSPDTASVEEYYRESPEGLLALGSRQRGRSTVRGAVQETETWIYRNPPYLFLPKDWTSGKSWRSSGTDETMGVDAETGRSTRTQLKTARTLRVAGRESVNIPLGTFDCLVLEATNRTSSEDAVLSAVVESKSRKWYSPELGWFVKEVVGGSVDMVPGKAAGGVLPGPAHSKREYSLILEEARPGKAGAGPLAGIWEPGLK